MIVDRAWASTLAMFNAVDASMSRFRDDSELTLLNRRVPAPVPSRMLATALTIADRAWRTTHGRFDPRIVDDLERLGAPGVPQRARGTGGTSRGAGPLVTREFGSGPVVLQSPVDLGGLGKGLALRWAAGAVGAALDGAPFLIDAGGDLVSRGRPIDAAGAGARGWSIGIEDPADARSPIATIELLPDQAIATSSVRIGRWSTPGGRPVHHLIDPATGEPGGDGLLAVTVAWADPAWAEVWSKALFLEGARGIAEEARRRGLAAWWVDVEGGLSMTPAARLQTTWVRAEASSAA